MEILNRILKKKVIVNCDRDPYLHRWYVFQSDRVALFVHKFVRSDEDRALHDHPWSFLVIPVWRGYIEHNDRGRVRVLPLLGIRLRPATYRHRVELLSDKTGAPLPSWSIFFRFRRVRDWGFWPKEGFTLWNKWWQDKCE